MFDFVVIVKGHRYDIRAVNRNKAIYAAVREYRKETGDSTIVDVLAALASCTKIRQKEVATNG